MKVDGKVAVVVGGASGMAKASAVELAGAGARIAILDLPSSEGAKVAEEIGNRAIFCPVDVMDDQIVETPMLNGSTIRLDAAQRFAPK